jgi:hypothetical protein
MLADEQNLDVVDLCVPTYVHAEYIVRAAQAGKHVIVEKPLTGYCGEMGQDDGELIGDTVPKARMMEWVLDQCELHRDGAAALGDQAHVRGELGLRARRCRRRGG